MSSISLPVVTPPLDVESAVRDRYSNASKEFEQNLCCAVDYDAKYLEAIPDEIIQRDYGCGDPSKHVHPGETVLDLGSGGGKICYIASQIVGAEGRVIGVDMNDDMLELARGYQQEVGDRIGWHNVEFHRGRIQDLALDLDGFESWLKNHPADAADSWLAAERHAHRMRRESPMIADDSVDVVVSNCVLNLVAATARRQLFAELFRVLKRHGRAVISDIVSDEPVPEHLKNDPKLWSGCISGAFVEDEFLAAFEQAGFHGIELLSRHDEPWATVEGIEFRSVTVQAFKGKQGPCLDRRQAVVYRGPWKSVTDDDGHILRRGTRTAVCDKTFKLYSAEPYADQIIPVPPHEEVALDSAPEFDCRRNVVRSPRETKGQAYDATDLPTEDCCGSSGGCC